MGPVVAVEIGPSPAPPRELATLVAACSRALPSGTCVAATSSPASQPPDAAASVHWADPWHAHVEAHVEALGPEVLTRDLAFAQGDPELERYRTLGLAIATMVDQLQERREQAQRTDAPSAERAPPAPPPTKDALPQAPPPARAAAPVPVSDGEHPSTAASVSRYALEVGGLAGTGLVDGPARAGLYARATYDVVAPVFVDASASYALSVTDTPPSVAWTDLGLGAGAYVPASVLRVELGVRVVLSGVSASAPDPYSDTVGSVAAWLPGVGASARVTWPAHGPLAGTVGLDNAWMLKQVRVTNAGSLIGRVSAYNVGIVAGLRLVL